MMTEDEVQQIVMSLPGTRVMIASADNQSPQAAWGDHFYYYDPTDTRDQTWPFITLVTHDTPAWDELSQLDRTGAFRVNFHVGRAHVPEATDGVDYAQEDTVLPHPQYAAQGWVAVVNPTTPMQISALAGLAQRRLLAP